MSIRHSILWDAEYREGGIPSSNRLQPSGVLVWVSDNWSRLDGVTDPIATALDVGCGTGRNAVFLANQGVQVVAFDASSAAVAQAMTTKVDNLRVLQHDLTQGLPVADGVIDLVSDIFVYKHQIDATARRVYRRAVRQKLAVRGRWLLSIALHDDGYYAACPIRPPQEGNPLTVVDPVNQIPSVLFSVQEIMDEVSDQFEPEMFWLKTKRGPMHGRDYLRRTLALLCKPHHRGSD